MPLLVNSVPNLAQGVSQQPDNLRFPGQCDEQINAWATVVEGLVKRPPTNYTKNIGATDPGVNLFTHFVKRDETNKYCVTVSLGNSVSIGQVGVIDLETGNTVSVAVTSIATSYLSGISNPLSDIRALTVADYTFLVNKNKTVAKDTTTLSQVPEDEAIVFVKLGDYDKSYSIYIDDSLVPVASTLNNEHDYTTHGDAPATYISGRAGHSDGKYADTAYIARDLQSCLVDEFNGTLVGIESVSIATFGTGYGQPDPYLNPGSQPGELNSSLNHYKAEVEISQSGVESTALGICTVNSSGELTDVEIVRKGSDFNPSNPFTYKITEYIYLGFRQPWIKIGTRTNPTPPVFGTPVTANRTALEITRKGSVIRLKSSDGPFKIRVEDGLSNEALGLAYQEVDSITDLPKSCFNNFTVKVIGDADIDQDDYFVRFTTKDKSEFGEGTWVETVGWTRDESESGVLTAIETDLDATTMPVTLVPILNGNGNVSSFKLQTPEEDLNPTPPAENGWRSRGAGNDATNPFPSFVGNKINDVFFFKNRLGFLTDSNVIF